MPQSDAKLFQPIRVGHLNLAHRIVFAPLTRFRADDAHVPTDIMVEYYTQRASVPGTLLIAEGTVIAARAGGIGNVPGIWSDAQVQGWKKVVSAVHAQGSYIYLQLWSLGRTAEPKFLSQSDCPQNPGGPYPYVSSSDLMMSERDDGIKPNPLSHEEILQHIELFGQAAHNAVHGAGFDGVEIHGAHGYIIDQFTQDVCNKRSDMWGGNIENRTRFALEIIKSVTSAVGEERTGIRLSPFATRRDMHMEHSEPTFAYLVSRIREAYPRFAYLHAVEPRASGQFDRTPLKGESLDFLRAIWKGPNSEENGSVFIVAGGYSPQEAIRVSEENDDLVAFGRFYISNPDLPARVKKGISLTPYNRATFYDVGSPAGYVGYAFADPEVEANYRAKRLAA
ncbi:NADH:flavin oxidoreductase/NADH oxidase [Fomitiporia mediterranea MF3/22]|uniref:NADH:flavin oxidoreductase/NADH oxidase n=1 Tax=Fomitiporia mediterranea (strain MF3/22) TaxID=694068 RepID=UPI0004409057|nr:NADH:flavin oxidoreductase/NADH oxidase [Fomitiporia mediterranea MF3/22]EJD07844.1 NADH:flavin oxidoreductase/NADH oxidase [Fomitiporia mediterranea MF3/22]